MFERVLLAFDGSRHARNAGLAASEICGKFHSTLTIVVVRPPTAEPVDAILANLVPVTEDGKTLDAVIEELRARATSKGASGTNAVFLRGEVREALLRYLDQHPQDLVVVGSRGLTRGRRLLLGSVSSGLVANAPCPVLVVRAEKRPSHVSAGGVSGHPSTVRDHP